MIRSFWRGGGGDGDGGAWDSDLCKENTVGAGDCGGVKPPSSLTGSGRVVGGRRCRLAGLFLREFAGGVVASAGSAGRGGEGRDTSVSVEGLSADALAFTTAGSPSDTSGSSPISGRSPLALGIIGGDEGWIVEVRASSAALPEGPAATRASSSLPSPSSHSFFSSVPSSGVFPTSIRLCTILETERPRSLEGREGSANAAVTPLVDDGWRLRGAAGAIVGVGGVTIGGVGTFSEA